MTNTDQEISVTDIGRIRLFVAFSSLILSLLAFYTDDLINSDGILYIHGAKAFIEGGLAQIQLIYNWPFYSILIAAFHLLTTVPIELSAVLVTTIFWIILTDAILLLASRAVSSPHQLFIAAILILCFYPLNEYRDFIFRDIGYWAFTTVALVYFVQYIEVPLFKTAVKWQLAMLFAILFRIEGIVLLATLPFYILIHKGREHRLKQLFILTSFSIIAVLSYFSFALGTAGLEAAFGKISSISNYMNLDRVFSRFEKSSGILANTILNRYAEPYSDLVLASGLITMVLYKVISGFSISYILLASTAYWQQKHIIKGVSHRFFIFFIIINLLILTTFLFNRYFVSTRYSVMILVTLLVLFIPMISKMVEESFSSKKVFSSVFASLLLIFSFGDSFINSGNKGYIKDVALWASQNLPPDSLVLTDNQFLNYYFHTHASEVTLCVGAIYQAKRNVDYRGVTMLEQKQCEKHNQIGYLAYDYLLVSNKEENKRLHAFLAKNDFKVIYEISPKKGKKATIYKIDQVQPQ